MKDKNDGYGRRCKANYPKPFQEETVVSEDGYPLCQRKAEIGPRYEWIKSVCRT